MNIETVYREEIPGFIAVFESVRRLSTFHKIEFEDMVETAAMAAWHHKNNIQAAIKEARQALNAERRQRLPVRPIDDRVDGNGDVDVEADVRRLPEGKTLQNLNEDGEYEDLEGENSDAGLATLDTYQDDRELPNLSPGTLIAAVIFLARKGQDVKQIATRLGRTPARIRQILRDKEGILKAVEDAAACQELPGFTCTPEDVRAPRKPIRHKPRVARGELEEDHGLSLFEMEAI